MCTIEPAHWGFPIRIFALTDTDSPTLCECYCQHQADWRWVEHCRVPAEQNWGLKPGSGYSADDDTIHVFLRDDNRIVERLSRIDEGWRLAEPRLIPEGRLNALVAMYPWFWVTNIDGALFASYRGQQELVPIPTPGIRVSIPTAPYGASYGPRRRASLFLLGYDSSLGPTSSRLGQPRLFEVSNVNGTWKWDDYGLIPASHRGPSSMAVVVPDEYGLPPGYKGAFLNVQGHLWEWTGGTWYDHGVPPGTDGISQLAAVSLCTGYIGVFGIGSDGGLHEFTAGTWYPHGPVPGGSPYLIGIVAKPLVLKDWAIMTSADYHLGVLCCAGHNCVVERYFDRAGWHWRELGLPEVRIGQSPYPTTPQSPASPEKPSPTSSTEKPVNLTLDCRAPALGGIFYCLQTVSGTGKLVALAVPTDNWTSLNIAAMGFLKYNFSTDQASDPSAVILLKPGERTSPSQMKELFLAEEPQLPCVVAVIPIFTEVGRQASRLPGQVWVTAYVK